MPRAMSAHLKCARRIDTEQHNQKHRHDADRSIPNGFPHAHHDSRCGERPLITGRVLPIAVRLVSAEECFVHRLVEYEVGAEPITLSAIGARTAQG